MRLKNYKKIIAGFISAYMLISATAMVNAARITSLPYSDNFDSYADETHTTTFDDARGNTGVTWFYLPVAAYNPGDILYLCDDDDTSSGHGKIIKYSNNTSLANTRMQYRFPKQTSGKVLFKCDIKVKNNSCPVSIVPCTTAYSEWTGSMVKFQDNVVSFYSSGEESDYAYNEWNTVACLIDIDAGKQTVFFKDKVVVTQVPKLSDFSALTFYWHSKDTKAEGATDVIYLDNVEIRNFSGEVKLKQGDSVVNGNCTPQDYLTLVIEDDKFISAPSGVKLIDYGSNPIECINTEIDVTPTIENGKMQLNFASALENGRNYKLLIPKGAKTEYSGKLDELIYEFSVAEDGSEGGKLAKVLFEMPDGTYVQNVGEIPPETKSVELYFSEAMTESALSGITITGDDTVFGEERKYDSSKKVYTITFTNLLKQKTEYTLSVPDEVSGTALSGKFKTSDGKFEIGKMMFVDENGNETNVFSNVKQIAVDVVNTAGEEKSYTVVGVGHEGFKLKGMYAGKYDLTSDNRKITMKCTVEIDEGVTELKGFLWGDIKSALPQNSGIVITK